MRAYNFADEMNYADSFAVKINGREYEGLATGNHVKRETVPNGWHAYDIRHNDGGNPCSIKNGVVFVNHYATFLTQKELPIAEGDELKGVVCVKQPRSRFHTFSIWQGGKDIPATLLNWSMRSISTISRWMMQVI